MIDIFEISEFYIRLGGFYYQQAPFFAESTSVLVYPHSFIHPFIYCWFTSNICWPFGSFIGTSLQCNKVTHFTERISTLQEVVMITWKWGINLHRKRFFKRKKVLLPLLERVVFTYNNEQINIMSIPVYLFFSINIESIIHFSVRYLRD